MAQPESLHNRPDMSARQTEGDSADTAKPGPDSNQQATRQEPDVVVLPYTAQQVSSAISLAIRIGRPVSPRVTNVHTSGEITPGQGKLVISTARMDKIVTIDYANQRALVQPGVVTSEFSQRLRRDGYQFSPDPAAQQAATIGGCVAANSLGSHSLTYGATTNHVLALQVVLHTGEAIWTGDGTSEAAGYDLTGLLVGSEGTLGVVTGALLRVAPLAEARRTLLALFSSMERAREATTAILQLGHLPASLEILDGNTIRAFNQAYNLGLPESAGALVLVELHGLIDGLDEVMEQFIQICKQYGTVELRHAGTEEERRQIWAAHSLAFISMRQQSPTYYLVDTVMPHTWEPAMVEQVRRLAPEYDIPMGIIFHAGDGSLHPLVMYNSRDPEQTQKAHQLALEALHLSIEQGSSIDEYWSAGVRHHDFISLLLNAPELQTMAAIYAVFNQQNRFTAAPVFPAGIEPLELAAHRRERIAASAHTLSRQNLAADLEAVVGREYVRCGADSTAAYAVQGQRPRYVVFPGSIDQLAEVTAVCHRAGVVVMPWGGGTRQQMGAVPVAPDVLIVTRRLNRVMQYEPGNLSVEVEAGMTLAELRTLLDTHGQMLSIDAPFPERTTIGGLVATATTGARRADCGGIRDLLLGMTVIEVDGTIIRNGTQMVKNIQGYDLTRLFVRSHGTLGIVACVNLRTFPRPQSDISLLVSCTEQVQAAAVLAALRQTPLRPVAVDYLDNAALHAVDRAAEGCALLMRVVGMHAACERHIQILHTIVQQHGCSGVTELRSDEHTALWERVEQLAALAELPEDEAVFRLLVPPASLNDALDHLYSCAAELGLPLLVRAHALNGIIYARVRGVSAETLATLQHHLIGRWSHSQILACNPAYKHHLSLWGAPPEGLALMQALKHTFDPEHKLNPGRYIV